MKNHSIKSIHRLGFHYFPDTQHYRESDLRTWLPKIRSLGASWLTLIAPSNRAIPEQFLKGVMDEGIQPVLHFPLPISLPLDIDELRLIFETYAGWGIRYVSIFDRPNTRHSWPATAWTQADLVERFLDIYLPLGEAILNAGLIPVFPPLEPGGDYWDTAFLRVALQGISRRGHRNLLNHLVLGAYGWVDDRPLHWGAGGPERWPGSRPYHTPPGQEDQRGFYIHSWYQAIAQAVLGKPRPIILLRAGYNRVPQPESSNDKPSSDQIHQKYMSMVRLVAGESPPISESSDFENPSQKRLRYEELPQDLLACNFWLLASSSDSPYRDQTWFNPDGNPRPLVKSLQNWLSNGNGYRNKKIETRDHTKPTIPSEIPADVIPGLSSILSDPGQPINHYLLLPLYEWGVAEWHLDVIRPFVKKYHPTIGFSLAEASKASRVTIIGGNNSFPDHVLDQLRSSGCKVERITGDGTHIATQLASL